MKYIAIAFYGHLRTWRLALKTIKQNLIQCVSNEFIIDVYMHTWDTIDAKSRAWNGWRINGDYDIKSELKDLKSEIDFKKIEIGTQTCRDLGSFRSLDTNLDVFGHRALLETMLSSLYMVKRSEELNNIHYNSVILLRPDLYFINKFPLDFLIKEIHSKELYHCGQPTSSVLGGDQQWICNDLICVGKCASLIEILEETRHYFVTSVSSGSSIPTSPEAVVLQKATLLGYDVFPLNFQVNRDYFILREKWIKFPKKYIRIKATSGKISIQLFPVIRKHLFEFKIKIFCASLTLSLGGGIKRSL